MSTWVRSTMYVINLWACGLSGRELISYLDTAGTLHRVQGSIVSYPVQDAICEIRL